MTSNGEDTGELTRAPQARTVARTWSATCCSAWRPTSTPSRRCSPLPGHRRRPSAGADVTALMTAGGVPFASSTSGVDGQAGAQGPDRRLPCRGIGRDRDAAGGAGDLLARLLTALIAVLEAVVRALQADSAQLSGPRVHTAYAPITVRVNRGSATMATLTIGIDIGGTSVRASVVDDKGAMLDTLRAATPRPPTPRTLPGPARRRTGVAMGGQGGRAGDRRISDQGPADSPVRTASAMA